MATALEDVTDCPVCWQTFVEPMNLACDHTLCKKCAVRITKNHQVKCPKCNKITKDTHMKPDFRIMQFMDALEHQAKTLMRQQMEENVRESLVCELCLKSKVSHQCEDCEQKICGDCKAIHLRAKATQQHNVFSLTGKAKLVRNQLSQELSAVEDLLKKYQQAIDDMEEDLVKAETMALETLTLSKGWRDSFIATINKLFDEYDARVSTNQKQNDTTVKAQKAKIENEIETLKRESSQIRELMEGDDIELAVEGEIKASQVTQYVRTNRLLLDLKSLKVPRLAVQKDWNVGKLAILNFMPLHGVDSSGEPNTSNSVSSPRKTNKVQTPDCAVLNGRDSPSWLDLSPGRFTTNPKANVSSPAPKATNEKKSKVQSTKNLKHRREETLPPYSRCIRHINGQLWVCHENGIQIFEKDTLRVVRSISLPGMASVNDVVAWSSRKLVVASTAGIIQINNNGKRLHNIDLNANFSCIRARNDVIFAAEVDTCSIKVYRFTNKSWALIYKHKIGDSQTYMTLAQDASWLLVCLRESGIMYKMHFTQDFSGYFVTELDRKTPAKWSYIYELDNGSVLILYSQTGRVVLAEKEQQAVQFELEPKPLHARSVFLNNGQLYVVCDNKLAMYS